MSFSDLSPADIQAVTGGNGNNGFMDNGSWWIIILFLFIFAGWGNGNAFGGGGVSDGYVLTSDFANIERKIDGVNNGLCDGFYTQAQLINGVNMNVANGFATAELARTNGQTALTNQLFQMQMQNADCCCENRQAIAGVNYNMATNTGDVIDNANANTRAILDKLSAQELEAKNTRIAELNQQINALQLSASQSAQNQYLINQLRPAPVPAFNVCAPYQYTNCGGCGCNSI